MKDEPKQGQQGRYRRRKVLGMMGAAAAVPLAGGSLGQQGGAAVDVWQCDAMGVYSGFRDRIGGLYDARGSAFLRGWELTDANGVVRFHTIYPGWYPGRAVHIHFKIRTEPRARRGREFTSQLYFDDEVSDRVFAALPYSRNTGRRIRNAQDRIFRRGAGEELLLDVQPAGGAYAAVFDIGLEV